MVARFALLLVGFLGAAAAAEQRQESAVAANPIRKVVTLLQMMQKKVAAEAEAEKELYEKYMCYCKTSGGALAKAIADADTKLPQLASDIEEAEAQLKKLKEDIEAHQADRAAAKDTVAKATAIRKKEAAAFEKATSEDKANIGAIEKAIAALEKGMAGGFLQTNTGKVLQRLVLARQNMNDSDRDEVLAFLSGTEEAPGTAEIVGILKQMLEEMQKDLAEAIAQEEAAIASYKELMAAKAKEIAALTKMIEEKLTRVGDLGVKIVMMKEDLSDTEEGLMEDKKFLADLDKNCATKKAEWAEICKMRSAEQVALADTIKILNDDDALELFKKTLPSSFAQRSFAQLHFSAESMRARAFAMIEHAQRASEFARPQMDLILMALRGKKVGFEKIIALIDELVASLKAEQTADDNKMEECRVMLDSAEDKQKELEHTIADLDTTIAKLTDGIPVVKEEVEALEDGIKALDKSVVEATEQRKEESEDYTELMANDSAAKELIGFAKNRLNKFYNPKLYTPPPKRELTEEERITVNNGGTLAPTPPPAGIAGTGVAVFTQVSVVVQRKDAPPPPPESFGAYSKKSEESGGVIQMLDMLVADLDKEMTAATAAEQNAQKDYETLVKDAAAKRAEDSKLIVDKQADIAEMEGELQETGEAKASAGKELVGTLKVIESLHGECDWLTKFYDVRKEARAGEIDALGKAKAVLSGADYSLLELAGERGPSLRR